MGTTPHECRLSMLDSPDGRALSEGRDPILKERQARITGLLRVELGRDERPVLDRSDEVNPVVGPGNEGWATGGVVVGQLPSRHSIRVDEIEALTFEPSEDPRPRGCRDRVPAHMRQDGSIERLDDAGPLAEALALDPMLDPSIEEDLHADADAKHWPPAGEPAINNRIAPHLPDPIHAGPECPNSGQDQGACSHGLIEIAGERDRRAYLLECSLGRSQIARSVVKDRDIARGHEPVRVPFVDGTPTTRGSRVTASRSERATDLNCASTT